MLKHLSEPWFSLVYVGAKTFEGRLGNNADFKNAPVGSEVVWFNDDMGTRRQARTMITSKSTHRSFGSMLRRKGVPKCLPTVQSVAHGEAIYEKFYSKAKQDEHGVLCMGLRVIGR
eukprot:jgi/Tetstr1/453938/TSEL_040857.t1